MEWSTVAVRREVVQRFKELDAEQCPFVNLPEKKRAQWALTLEEMKNRTWIKPELVAQIEFVEWTPDGHLRHAALLDCVMTKSPAKLNGRFSTLDLDMAQAKVPCAEVPHIGAEYAGNTKD